MEITPVILVKNDEYWLPYCLEAAKKHFNRFVIYDIGSTDRTVDVIRNFIKENPQKDFFVRLLPHIDPAIQGIFRNSMIAETKSEFFFILDADEVYTDESYEKIVQSPEKFVSSPEKIYGLVRRIEVIHNLKQAYGMNKFVPHCRVYHRTAIFQGPHPGEYPDTNIRPKNSIEFQDIICFHFHGCLRSSKDIEVPKRLERRLKSTYTPGELDKIDIFERLPILKKQICDFPVNPELKKLQNANK